MPASDKINIYVSVIVEIDGDPIIDETFDKDVERNGLSDQDWARFELLDIAHDI